MSYLRCMQLDCKLAGIKDALCLKVPNAAPFMQAPLFSNTFESILNFNHMQ